MKQRNCVPNLVTHNTLMEGFYKVRDFERASKIWDHILQYGLQPDIISYNITLKGLCSCHRISDAVGFLNDAVDRGVLPTAITWNILVRAILFGVRFDVTRSCPKGIYGTSLCTCIHERKSGYANEIFWVCDKLSSPLDVQQPVLCLFLVSETLRKSFPNFMCIIAEWYVYLPAVVHSPSRSQDLVVGVGVGDIPHSEPIRWTRDQVSAIPMTSMTTNARCSLPQVLEEQPFILVFLDLNFKVY
ncbi:Pentatricopeptide repeat-containing protein [Vitis vinifera]|uniref:Pentatricopeptide repeat-containing protein n=1 Tax=Vitis vinifera TaxID=29760 RepID=A0A438KPF6_VITVI|nr:Pentatricopeptide repeat-containing protein [Vitis vinifera]